MKQYLSKLKARLFKTRCCSEEILNGILGHCVGDALGVPVEFFDRESLKANPVTKMRSYGTHNQAQGTWSDDTSMTLCLLDSISRGLNYTDIMSQLLHWANKGGYTPHGDVFDITMQNAKWLTKLGAIGYDLLILINATVNYFMEKMGKGKISLSKKIKNGVKSAVKYINNFEKVCAEIAIRNKYDYVICGHIHQPEIKEISNAEGTVQYLNSGDWIENLTSLEYNEGTWNLYHHPLNKNHESTVEESSTTDFVLLNNKQLFNILLEEIYSEKAITITTKR